MKFRAGQKVWIASHTRNGDVKYTEGEVLKAWLDSLIGCYMLSVKLVDGRVKVVTESTVRATPPNWRDERDAEKRRHMVLL